MKSEGSRSISSKSGSIIHPDDGRFGGINWMDGRLIGLSVRGEVRWERMNWREMFLGF